MLRAIASITFREVVQCPSFGLTDLHRFLFGNASWQFLLEVMLRTGVTYVLLIVTMRLLGRRVVSQYTLLKSPLPSRSPPPLGCRCKRRTGDCFRRW